jgi:hypothetical protein
MPLKGALREPVTLDGATLALVPTPQRRKAQLNTIEGVRREMARIYRDAEAGKRDTADASKLTFMLAQIGKMLELVDIERRVDALENRIG